MSLPVSPVHKFHRNPESGLLPLTIGDLLLFIVALYTVFAINTASAVSPLPQPEAPSVLDLPTVKLDQTRTLAEVLTQIEDARVVFVGEKHTRYDHHLVQLEILKHLHQQSPNLVLGVEWFQQPFQQHLDDYIAGNISEQEMLNLTEYFNRWSYNYRLYQPILHYARAQKIPIIALNASHELIGGLHESGLDDLPAELKTQLPDSYDWSDTDYERRLREIFDQHPEFGGEFEDFMRSQLTWDESMADRAARYLQQFPDARMLILAGSGHIMFGSGIPNRIKRRIDVTTFSILVSEDFLPVSDDIADYLVLSSAQVMEPAGLIGAFLKTDGKLLKITGYSANSAVQEAGIEEGAVIIGVDGDEVHSLADFKLALLDKKPGDTVKLHYLENTEAGEENRKSVSITLR
jgi:uncharacterized iron-regulated protein